MDRRDKLTLAGFLILAALLVGNLYQTARLSQEMMAENRRSRESQERDWEFVLNAVNNVRDQLAAEQSPFLSEETRAVYEDGQLRVTAAFQPKVVGAGETVTVRFRSGEDTVALPAQPDGAGGYTAEARLPLSPAASVQVDVLFIQDGATRVEPLSDPDTLSALNGLNYTVDMDTVGDTILLELKILTTGEDAAPLLKALTDCAASITPEEGVPFQARPVLVPASVENPYTRDYALDIRALGLAPGRYQVDFLLEEPGGPRYRVEKAADFTLEEDGGLGGSIISSSGSLSPDWPQ